MYGSEGVYDVLTFQKSRGAKVHPGGQSAPPKCSLGMFYFKIANLETVNTICILTINTNLSYMH